MNKISFAVAAVYGASMAKAQACSAQEALPDQTMEDKMALAELNYSYLDACVQDGRVTYEEFEALIGDIGEGGADRAENVRKFQMMDLDNNNEISLVELLQHYRVKYYPVDLDASLPPFDSHRYKLYNYTRCPPKPSTDTSECSTMGYTREDLKAVLPLMYSLTNIIDDYPSYETYVSREFDLRDYNRNGLVERWETEWHDWHYKKIRGYWNLSKGAGRVQATVPDNGFMTYDEFNKDDNMLITRFMPEGQLVPAWQLQRRFWSIDEDRDGQLSWFEYWQQQQEDAQGHWRYRQLFQSIDANDDNQITMDELEDYYMIGQGMTAADADVAVEEFYMKYNAGERNGSGDDVIGFSEMWPTVHWRDEEVVNRMTRRRERQAHNFDEHIWYPHDANRDGRWTYDELIANLSDADALEIFDIFGKDPLTEQVTYAEVKQLVMELEWKYEITHGSREPRAIEDFDTSRAGTQRRFGAESEAEMEDILAGMDRDGDGFLSYNEMCRHFVHDSEFFCGEPQMKLEMTEPVSLPDYQ